MREWDLIRHIYRQNAAMPARVTLPPGDDMGAVRLADPSVLVTVDQLADGVHVDLAAAPVEKVARKAITRNLSDVAAMAAKPVGAVVAASLPRELGEERAVRLFDAMRQTAAAYDCPLFGGDVSVWTGKLLLTVTVLAEAAGVEPVLRQGACAGDTIYVTGQIGGSLETIPSPEPYTHHLDFEPRLAIARALASHPVTRPRCMIDLSDGLASDLRHLCEASGVAARVVAERLPISPAARQAATRSGREAWQHAVADGEDYELLFTAPPDVIPDELDGVPITAIGTVVERGDGPLVELCWSGGERVDLAGHGWEHRA